MNVLDETSTSELEEILKQTTADAAVKGVVITSARKRSAAGADLTMLEGMNAEYARVLQGKGRGRGQADALRGAARFSLLLRGIETCGKPFAAAINGAASAALSSWRSPATTASCRKIDKTRLGLPEVQGRAVPGRRRNAARGAPDAAADALQMLLKGDQVTVAGQGAESDPRHRARADLVKAAKDWIKGGGKAVAPWDEKGFKLPGGKVYSPAGMMIFPAGQRHLPPRDLRQLPGGPRHHELRL